MTYSAIQSERDALVDHFWMTIERLETVRHLVCEDAFHSFINLPITRVQLQLEYCSRCCSVWEAVGSTLEGSLCNSP